jgi:hypothetical protein
VALVGVTRLEKKDFLTAEIWNALMDILEAKFAGGIGTSDITYPLVVQGDIDFGQTYGIVGLRTFWNVVNAAEYASLDAAVSAVEATGGGAVVIPPYTTISANNVSIDASNVTIFGYGPTSVIQITAAATGPLLTTATSGITDVRIHDLTLDGTGSGAGCVGVKLQRVTRPQMRNVYMLGFTGDFIQLTNGGVAGQSCVDAVLQNVHMSGGSDSHVFADDVAGLTMIGVTSKSASSDAISLVPGSSSHLIQDVVMSDVRVHTGGAKGIRIVGSGATGIDAHSRIQLDNCRAVGMTGTPFEIGTTSLLLKDVLISNCFAPDAAGDAIRVASNRGEVSGNHVPGAGGKGINAQDSVDLVVSNNNCQDAVGDGIDADSTTDCTVVRNNVRDCADGVSRASSTGLRLHDNVGEHCPTSSNVYFDDTTAAYTRTTTGNFSFSYTVPGNTLKDGDLLRVTAHLNGGTATTTCRLNVGASNLASFNTDAADNVVVYTIRIGLGGATTKYIFQQARETSVVGSTTGNPTIDWTADQALVFECTAIAGSTVSLERILIEYMGAA